MVEKDVFHLLDDYLPSFERVGKRYPHIFVFYASEWLQFRSEIDSVFAQDRSFCCWNFGVFFEENKKKRALEYSTNFLDVGYFENYLVASKSSMLFVGDYKEITLFMTNRKDVPERLSWSLPIFYYFTEPLRKKYGLFEGELIPYLPILERNAVPRQEWNKVLQILFPGENEGLTEDFV